MSAALVLSGTTAAHASQTQQFRGEGSSSFGLAYYYALGDALSQADAAGYTSDECTVVDSFVWPGGFDAWVVLQCTR